MDPNKRSTLQRQRRKQRVRKKVYGVADRPRLTIFRSLKHIYAQIIDDDRQRTLVSVSSRSKELSAGLPKGRGGNVAAAAQVGTLLASKAKEAGIDKVVFDRNGYRYHGRIKAVAEAVRKGGVAF